MTKALIVCTLVALMTLSPLQARALGLIPFRLGTWGGALEAGYLTDRQNTHSPDGGGDIHSAARRLSDRLTIENRGLFVYDPRLFSGNLGLTFGMMRERDVTGGIPQSFDAKLTGYAFDSTILAEKPISGALFANRSQNFQTQTFSRSETRSENRGATVRLGEESFLRRWGIRNFSSLLRVEQEHLQETTTSVLGSSFRRDEKRDRLTYSGHNGFDSADLDWRYEHSKLTNLAFPQGNFQSDAANLDFSVDFGADLNRRSDTVLAVSSRSGLTPVGLLAVSEHVRVDHATNLTTDYRYQLQQLEVQGAKTTSQLGSFQARHQLYRNLTTTAGASATHTDMPSGTRDSYAGQLNLAYRRGLPWGGTVFLNAGGRHQLDNNRLQSSQVAVTDEAQAAPAQLGAGAGFALNQSFIVASSIVVVDARGGARLATTAGTDYDVVAEGNLIRIVPIPTSAVIQPGDPLVVSYTYQLDPSIKYATDSRSVGGGVDFHWIALSAGHEQSTPTLLAGQDSRFLQDVRRDNAKLDLRGAWKGFQGRAGAAYVRYDATRLAYTQQSYNQSLSYRLRRGLDIAFAADQALADYSLPAHRTNGRSMRLTLDWTGRGGWTAAGILGRRAYEDSTQPSETVNEAGLRARFDYGKLSLVSAITAGARNRGGFASSNWRLDLTATRRF